MQVNHYLETMLHEIAVTPPVEAPPTPPDQAVDDCPICGGMGVVTASVGINHPLFGKPLPCPAESCQAGNARRQAAWSKKLASAAIPSDYGKMTFQTFLDTLAGDDIEGKRSALAACTLWVQSPKRMVSRHDIYELAGYDPDDMPDRIKNSLVLFGDFGTGKTGLAISAVNALLRQGIPVLYSRCQDIIEEVQKRYHKNADEIAADILALYKLANVLMIDEFEVEKKDSENRIEIFESIMRYRAARRLPTIMTTNLNQSLFRMAWGSRTAEVVLEMAHWIPVRGRALRKADGPLEAL